MEQSKTNSSTVKDSLIFDNKLELKQQIDNIIRKIGIPDHLQGYMFIKDALNLVINDSDMLSAVHKEIYPAIAKKYYTTPRGVERAIRYAIVVSCSGKEAYTINRLLGNTLRGNKCRPTNKKLISALADELRRINRIG